MSEKEIRTKIKKLINLFWSGQLTAKELEERIFNLIKKQNYERNN